MSEEMTTHERMLRMYNHQEADRIPIIDSPWGSTIERWQREGMPKEVSYVDYFGLDRLAHISVDNSPRYERTVIEDTPAHKIYTTSWGTTEKQWKHATSTPEFLDFTIKGPDSWLKAKERMQPTRDRVDWANLQKNYKTWRQEGRWIEAGLWFGFDVTHSWIVGTERVLVALVEQPEWMMDMFDHMLDVDLKLLDMVWDAGYHFDVLTWCDDMGYKHNQFFSVRMYRSLLKKYHQRAIDWAHAHGIRAHLHSCGDVNPFVPELVGMGLDALNPLEVKAGMDAVALKKKFGDKLALHGGINAVLWDQADDIIAEMEQIIPVLKENGGYIFSSDHSVPDTVSLESFRRIIEAARRLGSYS
jgi:uroporphyrinogen decarboxylase